MTGEPARNASRKSAKNGLRLGTPEVTRAAKITAAVVGVLALAIGLWYARTAILLAFAGILLAIVLYGASRALAELTTLPRLVMLAAVVVAVAHLLRRGHCHRRPDARGPDRPTRPRHRRRRHHLDQGSGELRRSSQSPAKCRSGADAERVLEPVGHRHRRHLGGAVDRRHFQRRPDRDLLRHLFRRRSRRPMSRAVAHAVPQERRASHAADDVRDRRSVAALADRARHLDGDHRLVHLCRPADPRRADPVRAGAVRRTGRLPALSRADHRRRPHGAGRRRREPRPRAVGGRALRDRSSSSKAIC